jgi:hypothetical protein
MFEENPEEPCTYAALYTPTARTRTPNIDFLCASVPIVVSYEKACDSIKPPSTPPPTLQPAAPSCDPSTQSCPSSEPLCYLGAGSGAVRPCTSTSDESFSEEEPLCYVPQTSDGVVLEPCSD